MIASKRTSQELYPGRVEELAAGAGWTRHWEGDLWFPLEEPLPGLPGLAVPSDTSLELTPVLHGDIVVSVTAGGKRLELPNPGRARPERLRARHFVFGEAPAEAVPAVNFFCEGQQTRSPDVIDICKTRNASDAVSRF